MPFALQLPPYGGKSKIEYLRVCAKRGERPILLRN